MITPIASDVVDEFQRNEIVIIRNLVKDWGVWTQIQAEKDALVEAARPIAFNPHSSYRQVLPTHLVERDLGRTLRALYESADMKALILRLTNWTSVATLPLTTDGRFEINCKTNVYESDRASYLGWHFDQTFNYVGDQVVAVLTLENTSSFPSLEALPPRAWTSRLFHLGANSLSVHNPARVFHRVLTLRPRADGAPSRRTVFVMRYTNDATWRGYSLARHALFLAGHPWKFVLVGDAKWLGMLAMGVWALWAVFATAVQVLKQTFG